MTASDYPVNNPYNPPNHNGKDRAMPTATEIFKGNSALLSGNTGKSSGSHLHTQAGTDKATQKIFDPTPLEFKPGVVVAFRKTDPYIPGRVGGEWGKYVTLQVGGQYITYAHLSVVNVTLGQVIKEVNAMDRDTIVLINREYDGKDPSDARVKLWLGKDPKQFMLELRKQKGFVHKSTMIKQIEDLKKELEEAGGQIEQLKPGKYEVK